MKRTYACLLSTLILGCLTIAPRANAALLAYEGFDYAAGSALTGQAGGFGFLTPWGASPGTAVIHSPGMSYDSVQVSGNRLYVQGTASGSVAIFRDLAAPRGADGTTTWISLMGVRFGQATSTNGPGGSPSLVRPVNLSLFEIGSERLALGEGTRTTVISRPDTDVWGLVVAGQVDNAQTDWTTDSLLVDSFALVRIDHGAGNVDTAYMWINPSLAAEPDIATAEAQSTGNFTFNRIRPFAGNPNTASQGVGAEGHLDEFRIGETWADVVLSAPIPEPSTFAMLGLGALLLGWQLMRGRKIRK
jgi:hypothetical protein